MIVNAEVRVLASFVHNDLLTFKTKVTSLPRKLCNDPECRGQVLASFARNDLMTLKTKVTSLPRKPRSPLRKTRNRLACSVRNIDVMLQDQRFVSQHQHKMAEVFVSCHSSFSN